MWKTHRRVVSTATPYLPGSFDCPPRNPAGKINSGYKAWEFLMYIFRLGPGLLQGVLPHQYWKNFCKLVYSICIIHQHKITAASLCCAHEALLDFVQEFEKVYYQWLSTCLHFICPCLHLLIHLAPEVLRVGPGLCSLQWTME